MILIAGCNGHVGREIAQKSERPKAAGPVF